MPPRLIPVIDVMGGRVVRAIGGRRDEYRPIRTRFGDATDAVGIARRMAEACGAKAVYVADLDAIRGGGELSPAVVEVVRQAGLPVWVDGGFRRFVDVDPYIETKHFRAVIASETAWGPATLSVPVEAFGDRKVAFSIDLTDGVILGDRKAWGLRHPEDVEGLAAAAAGAGVRTVIVLDLAGVGRGAGPVTVGVCTRLRAAFPKLRIITGGGVRDRDDVRRLGDAGADAVLVASALHDGVL
jgi:phosphoribosylformimino-5-aminoimidazole carboxamide ribotide isomerase